MLFVSQCTWGQYAGLFGECGEATRTSTAQQFVNDYEAWKVRGEALRKKIIERVTAAREEDNAVQDLERQVEEEEINEDHLLAALEKAFGVRVRGERAKINLIASDAEEMCMEEAPRVLQAGAREDLVARYGQIIKQMMEARGGVQSTFNYAGMTRNVRRRIGTYEQHFTEANTMTVLLTLKGPTAYDWIDHHEACAMLAAQRELGAHLNHNRATHGGEGKGRIRCNVLSVYLLEKLLL
jgi:hypothetical protein